MSGPASGSISGDVANNRTMAFNRSDASTFAGAISGNGAVEQRGTGTTTLTGSNTYTGGTTIAAGTLQLGDGAFGTVQHHLVLDGRARGHNRIELSAAVVSHELTLRWLGLSAREARFEVQGRAGQAGPVTATLRLQASGLGLQPRGRAPEVTVDVESLTLQRLAWGQPLPAGS